MTKNAIFAYFWATILYKVLSHLKSAPVKFVKNESLTHTVNFDMGSAFSKVPRSAFSKGSGMGLGPLYKVCRVGIGNTLVVFNSNQ